MNILRKGYTWCKYIEFNRINANLKDKGNTDISNRLHSGRQDAVVNEDKDKQIDFLIADDRRKTNKKLFESLEVSHDYMYIFEQALGYSKVCTEGVHRILKDSMK